MSYFDKSLGFRMSLLARTVPLSFFEAEELLQKLETAKSLEEFLAKAPLLWKEDLRSSYPEFFLKLQNGKFDSFKSALAGFVIRSAGRAASYLELSRIADIQNSGNPWSFHRKPRLIYRHPKPLLIPAPCLVFSKDQVYWFSGTQRQSMKLSKSQMISLTAILAAFEKSLRTGNFAPYEKELKKKQREVELWSMRGLLVSEQELPSVLAKKAKSEQSEEVWSPETFAPRTVSKAAVGLQQVLGRICSHRLFLKSSTYGLRLLARRMEERLSDTEIPLSDFLIRYREEIELSIGKKLQRPRDEEGEFATYLATLAGQKEIDLSEKEIFRLEQIDKKLEVSGRVLPIQRGTLFFRLAEGHKIVEPRYQAISREKRQPVANSSRIYADILHASHEKAQAILQRSEEAKHFILLRSKASRSGGGIPLSDLRISFFEGRVYLRSRQLNKFILPSLISKYNFVQDENWIFKFLVLVGMQEQPLYLVWDWGDLGLRERLPAVRYQGHILSQETWSFREACADQKDFKTKLLQFQKRNSMPDQVMVDNFHGGTVVNLHSPGVIALLYKSYNSAAVLYFKRYEASFCFKDEKERPRHLDFEMDFLKEENPGELKWEQRDLEIRKSLERGKKPETWQYFKIYNILPDEALEMMASALKKKDFFYIWFKDPSAHLRLRFKAKDSEAIKLAKTIRKSFPLAEVQTAIYRPEGTLYGGARGLAYFERLSCIDSEILGRYQESQKVEKIICIMNLLLHTFSAFGWSDRDQEKFLRSHCASTVHDGVLKVLLDNKKVLKQRLLTKPVLARAKTLKGLARDISLGKVLRSEEFFVQRLFHLSCNRAGLSVLALERQILRLCLKQILWERHGAK